MAEDLPFASVSDGVERGGSFTSAGGNAFREDGRNESAVVQVFILFTLVDWLFRLQQSQQQ